MTDSILIDLSAWVQVLVGLGLFAVLMHGFNTGRGWA